MQLVLLFALLAISIQVHGSPVTVSPPVGGTTTRALNEPKSNYEIGIPSSPSEQVPKTKLLAKQNGAGGKFFYPNFQNRPSLNLNGDSTKEAGELVLTTPLRDQVGAAWFANPISLDNGFSTTFELAITRAEYLSSEGLAFVVQQDGPYVIGRGGSGVGYDGIRSGVAVELDIKAQGSESDPDSAHVSIHDGFNLLSSRETAGETRATVPLDWDFSTEVFVQAAVRYSAETRLLHVSMAIKGHEAVTAVGRVTIAGDYFVGFTAATGDASARFSVLRWAFASSAASAECEPGFEGAHCAVTNGEAIRQCPLRTSCGTCVEDVYNCVWCQGTGAARDKCVAGTLHGTQECQSLAMEPLMCANSLSHLWEYTMAGFIGVLVLFGLLVFRTLPMVQSFRAISMLVAIVGGAFAGMLLSFITSVALVEITETKVFAVSFGFFMFAEAIILVRHVVCDEVPYRGFDQHTVLLVCASAWMAFAGLSCLLVERSWVHWVSETVKVWLYMGLGGSINFCVVMSVFDLSSALRFANLKSWCKREHVRWRSEQDQFLFLQQEYESARDWRSRMKGEQRKPMKLATSYSRVLVLAFSSILSGIYFGYMFGTLRVGEESAYRVALVFQQESVYTVPVGAFLGSLSSAVLLGTQLPYTTDDEIDRLIREASDGL